jgi:hypothetical protein
LRPLASPTARTARGCRSDGPTWRRRRWSRTAPRRARSRPAAGTACRRRELEVEGVASAREVVVKLPDGLGQAASARRAPRSAPGGRGAA